MGRFKLVGLAFYMKQIGLLKVILESFKIRKVSSQLQLSHVLVFSLYSIAKGVPGPLQDFIIIHEMSRY